MNTNAVEALIGTLVIAIAAGFLVFAYSAGNVGKIEGYKLIANFDRVDGVSVGTDVRISGIKIGSVTEQKLDSTNYLAHLVLNIDKTVKIPDDSSVKVAIDGLLGGPYLAIQPGGSEAVLTDGGEIVNTQPSIDVVGLLSQAIFSPKSGSAKPASQPQAQPQAQPQPETVPGMGGMP